MAETKDFWSEKAKELKPIIRFNSENGFCVQVTIPARLKDITLTTIEGTFGESTMAEFPEGLLNVNSKRLREQLRSAINGTEHKVNITRSGTGYNTQYKIESVKPSKKPSPQ